MVDFYQIEDIMSRKRRDYFEETQTNQGKICSRITLKKDMNIKKYYDFEGFNAYYLKESVDDILLFLFFVFFYWLRLPVFDLFREFPEEG